MERTARKILFAGPVGSGKTTAIATVSETRVVQTEAKATDEVAERKTQTTVAMDYGHLRLGDGTSVQLVGAPGQVRFDFMWSILAQGTVGLILLIDNARPQPLEDLDSYLDAFSGLIETLRGALVIGITRTDLSANPDIDRYRQHLAGRQLSCPVLEVDARSRSDVGLALLALSALLNPHTRHAGGAS